MANTIEVKITVEELEPGGIWWINQDGRGVYGPIYTKHVADRLASQFDTCLNHPKETAARYEAKVQRDEASRLWREEEDAKRQARFEQREREEEERLDRIRERIMTAYRESGIEPQDFDAVAYNLDGGYGRAKHWRIAQYVDGQIELLGKTHPYPHYSDEVSKGKAVTDAREQHEHRVLSLVQNKHEMKFERRQDKSDREFITRYRVYHKAGRKTWSKSRGEVCYMYAQKVERGVGLTPSKPGDLSHYGHRAETVPAEFDTADEAQAWGDNWIGKGRTIVAAIKKPVRKVAA